MMARLSHDITLVLGADFLSSFARLPKKIQTKVEKFLYGFKQNPTASTYNYETLYAADSHLRSVRIDRDYRGILYKNDNGNTYILVWVDKHDDAYKWAARKVFQVHPETGSLQMIDLSLIQEPDDSDPIPIPVHEEEKDLFSAYRDRELIRLGIPEMIIPYIRNMKTEVDLEKAEGIIPQEAWEALFLLNERDSLQEVYNEVVKSGSSVNTSDIEAALENLDTKRRFVVITDDDDLRDKLTYPLDAWRVFLHPSQRKIVHLEANGPIRVLGGAGTGKTVVAMHRAKYLVDQVFTSSSDKILFTTYTKNLAADIRDNLRRICSSDQMRRIDVFHIDGWVSDFLHKRSYHHSYIGSQERKDLWNDAIKVYEGDESFPKQFFIDEWNQVIQQQAITTMKGYLKARRVGRGRSLRIEQRKAVWSVLSEYRRLLDDRMRFEFPDAARVVSQILKGSPDLLPYRCVIVDEAQDLDMITFKLLHEISVNKSLNAKNNLFITGDAHQRIYGNRIILSQCGIQIRGRSRKLRINYRTPEEVRSWAERILEGREFDDLDGGLDTMRGYHSLLHGEYPDIREFSGYGEEVSALITYIDGLIADGAPQKSICIVVRTNDLVSRYQGAIEASGKQLYKIKTHDERQEPGIRIATMHRVKGLEFNHIICPGVNQQTLPLKTILDTQDNQTAKERFETKERSLFYVAITRARKTVLVTSYGEKSRFIS